MFECVRLNVSFLILIPFLFAPQLQVLWQPYLSPVTLPRTEEAFILQRILGPHQTKCVNSVGAVPHITSVVSGAFTEVHQKEKLYTIHFVDCAPAHYNNYGKTRVYIIRDGKNVFDADLEGFALKVIDINYDGKDEWVSQIGFCNQGSCVQSITINMICGSQVIEYKRFDSVYSSHCGVLDDEKMVEYTVIKALPSDNNQSYILIPERKAKKCDARD